MPHISDPQLPICSYDIVLDEDEDEEEHTGDIRTQYDSSSEKMPESLT